MVFKRREKQLPDFMLSAVERELEVAGKTWNFPKAKGVGSTWHRGWEVQALLIQKNQLTIPRGPSFSTLLGDVPHGGCLHVKATSITN